MASSSPSEAPATSNTTPTASSKPTFIDCPVCSDPIDSCIGVFDCGHFACYKCALKIRRTVRRDQTSSSSNNNNNNHRQGGGAAATTETAPTPTTSTHGLPAKNPPNCFVCRKQISTLTVTEMAPRNPEAYIYEKSEMELLTKLDNVNTKRFLPLNCYVTSTKCATKLQALIDFVCPFDECWDVDKRSGGKSQCPFNSFDLLQRHLRQDHNGCRFCDTCAGQSISFLSELHVYTPNEMRNHVNGTCGEKDSQAFTGHPSCQFCHNKTLLDGESMLEHLKHIHYVCDFCNMSSYKFTYYNDRDSLNRHWAAEHKLCTHPDCAQLDPVARVFGGEIDLAKHMQERHNVKAKSLSLEAFGFRFDNEITLPSSNNNFGTSAANVQQMATQAAVGNTLITYDFVGSVRQIPLVPRALQTSSSATESSSSNNNNSRSNGNAGGRRQPRPSRNNNNNNNGGKHGDDNNNEDSNDAPAPTPAEEAKQKMIEANDNIQSIVNGLPSKQRDIFNDAVKKFLRQDIKAVEFFNVLHTKVVPEEDVLEFLFDNFAETLRKHPIPALREALISAKSIVLSAEAKRNKEASREENEQLARDQRQAKIRQLHQMTLQPGAGFAGGSSSSAIARGKPVSQVGGGNAWHQRQSPASNDVTSNIFKKGVASPPVNQNPWTKKMNDQSGMLGGANQSASGGGSGGGSGSGSGAGGGSEEFGNFTSSNNNNNNNNNGRRNNNSAAASSSSNNNSNQPPSLNEAFPTLQTTTRKGNVHPNQPANVKGDWKNNRLVKN